MSHGDHRPPAPWFGVVTALAFLIIAIVLSPPILGRLISLDWYLGDIRPALIVLQAVLILLAVVTFVLRRPLGEMLRRMFSTRKLFVFKSLMMLLSLGLAAGLLELGLRVVGYPFDESWTPSEFAIARFDEEIGWDYRPDARIVQPFGEAKRDIVLRFDAHGLRVPDDHVEYDPAAPTVLLVGGSYTMGHGVSFEESFAGQLAADARFPYQIVNLGVQGYGTDQALLMLRRQIGRFRDVRCVIYTFIPDHIARNANADRRILYRHGRFLGTKPRFALEADDTLRLVDRPRRYAGTGYCRLWAAWRVYFTHRGPVPSLALSRALIGELKRECEKRHAAFLVVHWRQGRPRTERGVELFAKGLDAPVVDTGVSPPDDWLEWIIPGDDHPTPQAHAHVADLIIEQCEKMDLGPRAKNDK